MTLPPSGLASIPPQPSAPEYPVSAIEVPTFTFESFAAANGAPPWDPTWFEQYWYDTNASTVPGDIYTYFTVGTDATGNPALVLKMIPASRARVPNIPIPSGLQTLGVVAPPARPLLADEVLVVVADDPIPGISTTMVRRTDLPAPPTPAGNDAILARLAAALPRIEAFLTKQGE